MQADLILFQSLWISSDQSPFYSLPLLLLYVHSYPLFELLQGPCGDPLSGLSVVTTHSEGTLWRGPYSLGYRSEQRPDQNVSRYSIVY